MRANDIIGLPVETRRGVHVGKVADIEIDVETHAVKTYSVSSGFFVQKLLGNVHELRIAPSQVISLSMEKMVVVDLEKSETVDLGEEEEMARGVVVGAKEPEGV